MKVFCYGTLLLPDVLNSLGGKVTQSVYVKGYKLLTSENNNGYPYFQLSKTGDEKDVVPGYIVEYENIVPVDNYEGNMYERVNTMAYTRTNVETPCQVYIKDNKHE